MGAPKAALDWQGTSLVAYVATVVAEAVGWPVIVVRSPDQELPPLPAGIEVTEDARPDRGPLEGLAAGLRALGGRADVVYVSATDVPLLRPAFVRAVVAALDEGFDAAVPRTGGHAYPLSAAYASTILPTADLLLAEDRLSMKGLLRELRVRWLDTAELAAADPALESLRDLDTPADLEAISRARAGPDAYRR
jgi:molybdopterin-guanine dinucleotide biosynthesis protein A